MACQLCYQDVPFLDNLAAGRHYNLKGSMACLLLHICLPEARMPASEATESR